MRVTVRQFEPGSAVWLQLTGPVAVLTIKRPHRKNALNRSAWATLRDWVRHLPAKTRLLVIRGAGGDFSSGSDLKEFASLTEAEVNQAFELMENTIAAVESLPIPTLATIDGGAYGAAFVLTLACDLRLGTSRAKLGIPVGKLGITLQPPFVRRILRELGPSAAKDLVFTGRILDADMARAMGILNDVVPPEHLTDHTIRMVRTILRQSRASVLAMKESVRKVIAEAQMEEMEQAENRRGRNWVYGPDFFPAVSSFAAKRAHRFERRPDAVKTCADTPRGDGQ
ncbi:enoyl-CoA hydratase/isomerase family protein [Kyrpidia spormannii]|uniref:3-hydroxybutyryl-CoA dehydratase n=1 Tax=Kyrpidia spormannii TaxID=2055160 RepID=A0ACA8ZCL1_9BACL|nr:enoyl-CoA hydratase/isomerase family protein [Kyrpidia spormannii]CAB3395280.1 3-hydroxybutyryl-CoA dehydratase [Kyrpidia spormannii]